MTTASVAVIGASGPVGSATTRSLDQLGVSIQAGTRDPSSKKAIELQQACSNVKLFTASMSEPSTLVKDLQGIDVVAIIPPEHADNCTQASINTIDAVIESGVKLVVIVSVNTAEQDSIFGRQFRPIEDHLKRSLFQLTCVT
eukprot:TRINITY_DN10158_c0_g1_i3.p3 TRINITY_DN10158_c0_g1~~TRINITY_DN10158_c0_g1_i3.p3  ORF type:complete len:142 (+),score=41.79 TRINITY_DN10158_c0_g1_i3:2252-2677(+)